ncbi:MAG: hypothetical protein RR012_08440 [Oscillospiraceae bacterium]
MTQRKTRMVRDNSKQGTDCYTFEVVFQGELKNLPKQPLINDQGRKYGTVEVKDGKATVALVLPQFVRDSNVQPFTLMDSIYLEIIKNDCEKQLKQLLGAELNSKVKSIECNITQKVSGNATQSDVLNLLSHAFLSSERDNIKYVGANKRCRLKEETHTVIARRPHYYILKAYDKTEQQKMELKKENKSTDTVPDGLLRIEIIMVERTIDKLFGDKISFSDILTKDSLIMILREYKRIFCEDIIDVQVKQYLNACVLHLIESLCDTETPLATIAKEREMIADKEVLRKALKKWQTLRGKSNHNLLRDSEFYASKYDLPQNVLLTLHDFKVACG